MIAWNKDVKIEVNGNPLEDNVPSPRLRPLKVLPDTTMTAAYDPAAYAALHEAMVATPTKINIQPADPDDEACVNEAERIRQQIRSQLPERLRPAFDRGEIRYHLSQFKPAGGTIEGESSEITITATHVEPTP